jgi:hypothetical protein
LSFDAFFKKNVLIGAKNVISRRLHCLLASYLSRMKVIAQNQQSEKKQGPAGMPKLKKCIILKKKWRIVGDCGENLLILHPNSHSTMTVCVF